MAKAALKKEEGPLHQQIGNAFKEETSKVLKLEHCGKQIRNTWKVVKYDAGEGWRRSAGHIV
jgi:hypothetical protein